MLRRFGLARGLLATLVAACLAAASCEPAPSTAPSPTQVPGSPIAPPVATSAPASSPAAAIPFADDLRDAVDVDRIVANLARLQAITDEHGGARPAGSEAYDAAATFVADELRAAGFDVEVQPVEVPFFSQLGPSVLEIQSGASAPFEDLHDFKAMLFSASGKVTAPVFELGFDRLAQPGDRPGLGCNSEDWADVPAGTIVLVQPATCRRHEVAVQAQLAGALGLVTSYPEWTRDTVLRPTLVEPADIRIPVLGATHAVGIALADAAAAGASVRVATHTASELRQSMNVIGETPGGDAGHVVMLGGHLDSTVDGPGINDDGSGTMTVLEIARALASVSGARWKVRVGFWTGEEIGLWGSGAYVRGLDSVGSVEAYLNLDMLGSPNGVRILYDGAYTSRPRESLIIGGLFSRAFESDGLVWQSESLGGSSDHYSFDRAGVPTSGIFSGGTERKSTEQAALFGGTADAANDPCFHLACDTTGNINPALLGEMARVAAWVTGALASGEVDLAGF